ncbi:MAG TPA: EAL domain-containing protein [Xanthomonadaceae bacterium]|nr:EAL domain-containing protein [Xanthomonadaceae bacterium]
MNRAIAIESSQHSTHPELARLRQSVRHLERAERLQRALFAIADVSGSDLDMSEMLRRLHEIVGSLMYAENLYIALYDRTEETVNFIYFVDVADKRGPPLGAPIPLSEIERGMAWYLIHDARPLRGDHATLRHQVSGPLHARGADSMDFLGVPMLDGTEVRGALVVQSYDAADRFSASDQDLLSFVASHVLTALKRKQAHQELERAVQARTAELASANRVLTREVQERQRGERLQGALYHIAELAGGPGSMDDFYRAVHGIVGDLINARNFYIALPSEDGRELTFPYYVDAYETSRPPRLVGNGLTEHVLKSARPLLGTQQEIESLMAQGVLNAQGPTSLFWLGAPLLCDGKALGVVAVQSYSDDIRYTERDMELLVFVSYQIASSLERRRAAESLRVANAELELRVAERTRELREQIAVRERVEARLKHEVRHDALTGLPNRQYLLDRLKRLLARHRRNRSRGFAVLLIDVDRFKLINDSVGHHAGDEVLKEVAARLSQQLREPDIIARLGGDEFALLLEDVADVDEVVRVARRLLHSMEEPTTVGGRRLHVSLSVGVALCDSPRATAEDLLRNADTAMYRAKANGRQRFELFDERLQEDALRVLELENDLRVAIAEQQFEPHFQPIVALPDARVLGYEALMRWHHPGHGLLRPDAFLRVAEDSGCIEAMDWQIYAAACSEMVRLKAFQGFLSLNVAPRHFRQAGFGSRLLEMAQSFGLPPHRICVEITEGTLIEDPERTGKLLRDLRDAGVALALDDFGTGYSSLGYLHRFPLSILKIDRSFVAGLGDGADSASTAVARAVLALAGSLGLAVVAEGIETPAQQTALVEMGCELGQGYLLGRPGPLPSTPVSRQSTDA